MPFYQTGKQRTQHVDLRYPRQTDRLKRSRLWLSGVAAGLAVVYSVYAWVGPSGAQQFSHGPVSRAHAAFEADCQKCHEPFTPIRSDSWGAGWLAGSGGGRWGQLADAKCKACHNPADHHADMMHAGSTASCASCHVEHRGRDAHIARTSDSSCLDCHSNLDVVRLQSAPAAGRGEPIAAHIGRFDRDHPEFRSLGHDPGTITRFSHKQHLAPGIWLADVKGSEKSQRMTWGEVTRGTQVVAPAGAKPTDVVQLDCASCHVPGADGRYMQEIAFEKHCAGCHTRDLPEGVAHGLDSGAIEPVLENQYWQTVGSAGALKDVKLPVRPLPGQTVAAEVLAARDALTAALRDSRRKVQEKCQHCHTIAAGAPQQAPQVAPAGIPSTWLRHAEFSHAAHANMQCAECHSGSALSTTSADVSIPQRETCVKCHSPQAASSGGAGYDCAECHKYHPAGTGGARGLLLFEGARGESALGTATSGATTSDPATTREQ